MPEKHSFKFTIIGRYRTHLKANEPAVKVSIVSGVEDHLTYAGALTMSEAEWETFIGALRSCLKDRVGVEDHSSPDRSSRETAAKI